MSEEGPLWKSFLDTASGFARQSVVALARVVGWLRWSRIKHDMHWSMGCGALGFAIMLWVASL